MLKIEKIKEEIEKFDTNYSFKCQLTLWSLNKKNQDGKDWGGCMRDSDIACSKCMKMSLLELLKEYKKPVKLTTFEYEYLKHAKKNGYYFIARDECKEIYLYKSDLFKSHTTWRVTSGFNNEHLRLNFIDLFDFVKWGDENPWKIDEILSNCEVIEDDL